MLRLPPSAASPARACAGALLGPAAGTSEGSLDVTATIPAGRVEELGPKVERMLRSIRPVQKKAEKPAKPE